MRTIKFRAWDKDNKKFIYYIIPKITGSWDIDLLDKEITLFTGLNDKNGKEIYELMEIDGKYKVIYQAPKYVLQDILNGDVIDLYENKHTITKEYTEL
jgi:hypothetical protein